MKLKFETTLDYFIFFIVLIKIVFILSAIGHLVLKFSHNDKAKEEADPKLIYWKERTEFIFIVSMSLLLIYHFRPSHVSKVPISEETALLFFLFGWILLFTSKWSLFFKETKWLKWLKSLGG